MKDKVIVFGYGRYFHTKEKQLKEKYDIIGFLDNSVKNGAVAFSAENLKIINPTNLQAYGEAPVMIMSVKFFEMWKQLKDMRVSDDRILFGMKVGDQSDEFERFLFKGGWDIHSENNAICLQNKGSGKLRFSSETELKEWYRNETQKDEIIQAIRKMPKVPVSRRFGLDRGKAIDRFYIEKFLETNCQYICGDVMEIGDNRYTMKFGRNIKNSYILHVNGWGENVIKGDFATGEGIRENTVDCLIFTQTLQHIFDKEKTIRNIYKVLKPGGAALLTSGFIAQLSPYDYYNWGEFWRLTDQSMKKLLMGQFEGNKIKVRSYGNVKTAMSFLYGLCQEDLEETDYSYDDEQYPVIVAGIAQK